MPYRYDQAFANERSLLTANLEVHSKYNRGVPCLEKKAGRRLYKCFGFNMRLVANQHH